MSIHREGYRTIAISVFLFGILNFISFTILSGNTPWLSFAIFFITIGLLLFVLSFFRVPVRSHTTGEDLIICPADGKVVAIEKIIDEEYFKDERIQVSIFMSPLNVHLNRSSISGKVLYSQYHPGKFLVAWHPKSSTENERHSVVIENGKGIILIKQIAGAVARRICNYCLPDQQIEQGEELGFIKFGSRVDVLLPLNAVIKVQINEMVQNGVTTLAAFN